MEKNSISLNNLFKIIKNNYILLLITVFIFTILGIIVALTTQKIYEVQGTVLLNLSNSSMQTMQNYYFWYYMPNIMNNQVYIVKSYSLMRRVYHNLPDNVRKKILAKTEQHFKTEDEKIAFVSNYILANLFVKPMEESDIILFSFDSDDPVLAKEILTVILKTYRQYDLEIQKEETEMVQKFLENETEIYKKKLDEAESLLKLAKTKFKSPYLGNEAKSILDKYSEFQSDYYTNKIDLAEKKEHLKFLQNKINEYKKYLKNSPPIYSDKINYIIKRISELEAKKISLKAAGYKDDNEKIKEIDDKLAILYNDFKKEMNTFINSNYTNNSFSIYQQDIIKLINLQKEIAILTVKNQALKKILDQYEKELSNLPAKQLELTRLIRNVSINEKMYNMLKQRLEEAKIQNEGVLSKIKIIDEPVLPSGPIKPKRRLIVMIAFVFGFVLGLFLIMLKYYLFTPINGIYLRNKYNLKFYFEIPNFSKLKEFNDIFNNPEFLKPNSVISEYLHLIRLNCEISKGLEHRITLITSPNPNMGKTTVSYLLALANSAKKKVLLVDLDLKKPGLHKLLNIQGKEGIFEYFKDEKPLKNYIQQSKIKNLDIIFAGKRDENIFTTDILLSNKLIKELNELKEEYDYIFIDSAPLSATTDSLSIAKVVDNVFIIFHATKSTMASAENIIQRFKMLHISVEGLILNFKSIKERENYYYEYYMDEKES